MNDWIAQKGSGCVRDSDDPDLVVVHLQFAVEFQWFTREEQNVAGVVDNDGVRLLQPLPGAEQHFPRSAGQRRVVEAEQNTGSELSRASPGDGSSFEKLHGPFDTGHTAYSRQVGVLQRFGLLEIFGLRIHHPYIRIGHVENLTAGALENARENRRLVLQQKGAKGDGENQPEILGAISGQHSQSYEVHGGASIVPVYR